MECQQQQIVCSAAGRVFKPGMLYNAVTDEEVTGFRLWNDENYPRIETTSSQHKAECVSSFEDSFESRSNLLDINGSLKLSFMAGMVKLSGSTKYLNNKKTSFKKERAAVVYRCVTEFQEMILPAAGKLCDNPKLFDQPDFATHIVTGVKYGGTAVFVFEREKSEGQNKQEISGSLEACVKLAKGIGGKISGELTEEEEKNSSKVSCSYYGDLNLEEIPQTYQEALNVMKNFPKYVGKSAVEVTLTPLSRIDTRAAKLGREISSALIDDVGNYMQDLDEVLAVTEQLKGSALCKNLGGIRSQLDDFWKAVSDHKRDFMAKVAFLIPKIRSASVEKEDELWEFLNRFQQPESPFHSKYLVAWIEHRECEMGVLQVWLEQVEKAGAKLVLNEGTLQQELAKALSTEPILVIRFPSYVESQFLRAMENYRQRSKPAAATGTNSETIVDSGSITSKSRPEEAWCSSESMTALDNDIRSLLDFLDQNRSILSSRVFVSQARNRSHSDSSAETQQFRVEKWMLTRGKPEVSFEVPQVPSPPAVGECTSKTIKICWRKPAGSQGKVISRYGVQYQQLRKGSSAGGAPAVGGVEDDLDALSWDDATYVKQPLLPDSSCQSLHVDEEVTATVKNLKSSATYAIRIQAITPLGSSTFSPAVIAKTQPPIRCAIAVRDSFAVKIDKDASNPIETFSGTMYELKKARAGVEQGITHGRSIDPVDSFEVGDRSVGSLRPAKVMLVVGQTGSGKTTVLNGIANAYYKVKFEDDFRFKLINETVKESDRTVSQTRMASVYTLHPLHGNKEESSASDFPLVLIDTPGFGDTEGLKRDQLVVQIIRDLLSGDVHVPGLAGMLHAIGFVVQASLSRLTPSQKYVFDQVLSLFGKDMAEILAPLITFSDQNEPAALAALKKEDIPGNHKLFIVNNTMLYADNKRRENLTDDDDDFGDDHNDCVDQAEIQWKSAARSYVRLFGALKSRANGVTLKMTRDVLRERQQLELAATMAHQQVEEAHIKLRNISENAQFIRTLSKSMDHAELNMKKTVTEPHVEEVPLESGKFTTLCLTCNRTCHEECCISRDEYKEDCDAISPQDGRCFVCPARCHWTRHRNVPFIIKVTEIVRDVTVQELFDQFQIDSSKKEAKKKLIAKMMQEYEVIHNRMTNTICTIHKCLQSSDKIALRQYPLSVTDYVDLLIHCEEDRKSRGWGDRVRQLKEARR